MGSKANPSIVLTPYQRTKLATALEFARPDADLVMELDLEPGRRHGRIVVDCPESRQHWDFGPGAGARSRG